MVVSKRRCRWPAIVLSPGAHLLQRGLALGAALLTICQIAAAQTPTAPDAAATNAQHTPLRLAVAANFRAPLQALADEFERLHGIQLSPSFGSSGLLAAQIHQGAPFDAFFSADMQRPNTLVRDGIAAGPVTTYAQGRIALRFANERRAPNHNPARRIGIPNPQLAPYGAAAVQCLQKLGVWRQVQERLVFGNNVNQIEHFLESGTLKTGFVALSHIVTRKIPTERYWLCPNRFHAPIDQGAVVLHRSRSPEAARSLLRFIVRPATQARLARLGYAYND